MPVMTLYTLRTKSFMLHFATFLVQVHNRPTTECQFLLIGKMKSSTGSENHTLTASTSFILEITGI